MLSPSELAVDSVRIHEALCFQGKYVPLSKYQGDEILYALVHWQNTDELPSVLESDPRAFEAVLYLHTMKLVYGLLAHIAKDHPDRRERILQIVEAEARSADIAPDGGYEPSTIVEAVNLLDALAAAKMDEDVIDLALRLDIGRHPVLRTLRTLEADLRGPRYTRIDVQSLEQAPTFAWKIIGSLWPTLPKRRQQALIHRYPKFFNAVTLLAHA